MRVGVTLLLEHAWEQDRHRWKRAEQYGFDHAWTFHHLAWRSLADSAWYATIPTLVAAALETSALRLGTWVTTPNFRHPVPLAKQADDAGQDSSGGRNIGLGAGVQGSVVSVLGQPAVTPAQASSRFSQFVMVLDLLLSQPRTTWQGQWFSAVDARNIPALFSGHDRLFIVAANGPKGIRLAVDQAEGRPLWARLAGTLKRGVVGGCARGERALRRRAERSGASGELDRPLSQPRSSQHIVDLD